MFFLYLFGRFHIRDGPGRFQDLMICSGTELKLLICLLQKFVCPSRHYTVFLQFSSVKLPIEAKFFLFVTFSLDLLYCFI